MANLYKNKRYIQYPKIQVGLSKSLSDLVDWQLLHKMERQIANLPVKIPRLQFYKTTETLGTDFNSKKAKAIELTVKARDEGIAQSFVAYEPDATYSLGNTVGKVWAQTLSASGKTSSGLILLNDKRIAQVSEHDRVYLANLILHEVLHIYGLAHAEGLPFTKVKNTPVMNAGKFGCLGLSYDDKVGLKEIYGTPQKRLITVEVTSSGGNVGLLNLGKKNKSQGKTLVDGKAIFTHVPKGRYSLYISNVKKKTFNLKKDISIVLEETKQKQRKIK